MTTTIFLARHGKTAANRDNRFAGRTDEPLLPEGVRQAEALAAKLTGKKIKAVAAGPRARTRETAGVIAARLGIELLVDQRLDEIFLPHWDGLTKEEITHRFGDQYPTWLNHPERFRVAGCETILDVQDRVVAAVAELAERFPGEHLVVISHLIPIRALLLHHLGLPISRFRTIEVANGQLVELTLPPGAGRGDVRF